MNGLLLLRARGACRARTLFRISNRKRKLPELSRKQLHPAQHSVESGYLWSCLSCGTLVATLTRPCEQSKRSI